MDDYIENIKYKYPFYVIIFCYTEAWVEALKSRACWAWESRKQMQSYTLTLKLLFLIQVFFIWTVHFE